MELLYECATIQDIEPLYQLNQELIDAYEDTSSIEYEKVLSWVRRKITTQITGYTRVRHNGETVGYYRLVPCNDGLELDDLYILKPFRNQGIGSQILHRCCESGKPLMLYVFSKNTRAIRLYRRFGFKISQEVSPTRFIMRRPGVSSQEDL